MKLCFFFFLMSLPLYAGECSLSAKSMIRPWQESEFFGNSIAFQNAQDLLAAEKLDEAIAALEISTLGDLSPEYRARVLFYQASLHYCLNHFSQSSTLAHSALQLTQDSAIRHLLERLLSRISPEALHHHELFLAFQASPSIPLARQFLDSTSETPHTDAVRQWLQSSQDSLWNSCVRTGKGCESYFDYWPHSARVKSIGLVVVRRDDKKIVVMPLPLSPAETARIPFGAELLQIGTDSVKSITQATQLLREGPVGDTLHLFLKLQDTVFRYSVQRKALDLSQFPPLHPQILARLRSSKSDSIECKDSCTIIVLPLHNREIQVSDLKKFDSLLTPEQSATFSQSEIDSLRVATSLTSNSKGLLGMGGVFITSSMVLLALVPEAQVAGIFGILAGASCMGLSGHANTNSMQIAKIIREHNQRLKDPKHIGAGKPRLDL